MNTTLLCSLGAGLLGLARPALGQQAPADSSLLAAASHRLSQHYTTALGIESRLYNGPEYVNYVRHNAVGHRFFATEEAWPATVTYAGYAYHVPLRYDLVRGQLVLTAPGGALQMALLNEQVARFTLGEHSFTRLVVDSSAGAAVRTGFYEVLVDGPVQLLAAHHKMLHEQPMAEGIQSQITARTDYFVHQAGRYYPVSKAATLLRLFPEHKAALRQYSKAHDLQFKPETREQALTALVRYEASLAAAAPR